MHGSVGRIRSSWLIKKLKDSKLPEVILLLESSSVSVLEISYLTGKEISEKYKSVCVYWNEFGLFTAIPPGCWSN